VSGTEKPRASIATAIRPAWRSDWTSSPTVRAATCRARAAGERPPSRPRTRRVRRSWCHCWSRLSNRWSARSAAAAVDRAASSSVRVPSRSSWFTPGSASSSSYSAANLATCALAFSNYLIRFLKWEYYLGVLEIRGVPKGESLLIFLSGFVLTVTPGKVGEVFKSLILKEIHGVPVERTAPIVVAERVTDLIGVITLIAVGAALFAAALAVIADRARTAHRHPARTA